MNFTPEQKKLIYDALRHYQISRVSHDEKDYRLCDEILNDLFVEVKIPVPPTRPINGFGFNT